MVTYVREGWTAKIIALFGFVLQLIIVAIPKDFIRWLCLRRKIVKGKCIVITGGASGIGHRMAELFADPNGLGAQVAIIDINLEAAEKVAEAIRATGGVAEAWNCDIVNADELRHCAAKIQQRFGHVDIVVANAGILFFELTLNLRDDELKRALDVNILGTINTIRAFLPAMEAVGHGHLVTIASIASYFGETFGMAYCPTKFAVRGAMDCLRMELNDRGMHNIKCTTICPFFVRTPMITSIGIRPMSSWIPFLSVNRCAHQIIDAVLKEKVIAFMPWWLGIIALMQSTFSLNMQRVARDFINFRYEAPDYFFVLYVTFYNPELVNVSWLGAVGQFVYKLGMEHPNLILIINLLAWSAHLLEAVCALYLTDALHISHRCSLFWFLQTLLLGFPSLRLLLKLRRKFT
uniref:3Beta_HSD domain-containing protein n=1 Tax=Globodera pallida TaxID=36090 RepID=A0A183CBR2_GLOPA